MFLISELQGKGDGRVAYGSDFDVYWDTDSVCGRGVAAGVLEHANRY